MPPTTERSPLHLIDKHVRSFVRNDLRCHPPANSEMPSAPGHRLTQAHAAGTHAADDTLGRRCCDVNANIERDVKADLRLRRDVGDEIDVGHVRPDAGKRGGRGV